MPSPIFSKEGRRQAIHMMDLQEMAYMGLALGAMQ
jgi:hypothetical protein